MPPVQTTALSPDSIPLLDLNPLPIWVIDLPAYKIRRANAAARNIYGSVEGSSFLHLFSEESGIVLMHQLNDGIEGARLKGCYRQITVEGRELFVELHLSFILLGTERCCYITAVDVSSHVSKTANLKQEAERYRDFIRRTPSGIFCRELRLPVSIDLPEEELVQKISTQAYFSECNAAFARHYGISNVTEIGSVAPSDLFDLNTTNDLQFLRAFVRNGFSLHDYESREKDSEGKARYFLYSAIGAIENGKLVRLWGSQTDITERKEAEDKLRLLANLVEQTSDVLTIADLNYNPVTWNSASETIYGLKGAEVVGKDIRDFITLNYKGFTREEVRDIIARKGEWRGEMSFTRPTDKKLVTLLATFKLLMERGRPLGILISAKDITDRIENENRIRESENRFRNMAGSAPVMIWMTNAEGVITYLNSKWIDFTGNDITNESGESWSSLVYPEDLPCAKAIYDAAYAKKEPVDMVYRLKVADGSYRWVKDFSAPRILNDGKFVGYIGTVVDIHAQKSTEEQLRYHAQVLENVSEIVITTGLDFRIKVWNKAAEYYYGVPEAEAIGKLQSELVPFHFHKTSLDDIKLQLLETGSWQGEVGMEKPDKSIQYFYMTMKDMVDEKGEKTGYLVIGHDITEKVGMEKKLEKSEHFYRALIADSLDVTMLLEADGQINFCSPSITRVLGYEYDEVVGRSAFSFVHPDDLQLTAESFDKEVIENSELKFITVRIRNKAGNWVWCMLRAHNMLSHPDVASIVIYLHDDTPRKQAAEALRESERRFRTLIKDLQIGVMLQDSEGRITMVNNVMTRMFHLQDETLYGKQIWKAYTDIIHEDGRPFTIEERPSYKAMKTGVLVKDVVMGVWHPERKMRMWLLVSADPIIDDNGERLGVVCSFADLTERKKLEKKLLTEQINHQKQLTQATIDGQEAERREIGKELHDNIGQQLTTIKLFLDMLKTTTPAESLDLVNLSIKGVSDVINGIRDMSRSLVPYTLKDLGLVDSIGELVDNMGRVGRVAIEFESAEFEEDHLPDNQKLMLFRIVQEQFNNISKYAEARNISILLRSTVNSVGLMIQDDGKGFDLKTVKRGLGFANISSRTELFGGRVEILSAPGAGCVLKVNMPVVPGGPIGS